MIQPYFIAVFALLMVGAILREQAMSRSLSENGSGTWDEVLYQLKAVRTQGLKEIAGRRSPPKSIPSGAVSAYFRIGGEEGLRRLFHNSHVLAELACCSLDWGSIEGETTTAVKNIRQVDLRFRLLARISAVLVKYDENGAWANRFLQQLASMYCDMVDQLIQLYLKSHVARVDQLAAACNWQIESYPSAA